MYPVSRLEFLDFIVNNIHTREMSLFSRALHIEIDKGLSLGHLRAINLSGIIVNTEKVVDLLQIRPSI